MQRIGGGVAGSVCGEVESGISDALSFEILSEKNFKKLSDSRDEEL